MMRRKSVGIISRAKYFRGTLTTILCMVTIIAVTSIIQSYRSATAMTTLKRSVGNLSAGSDLYGIGVRVGLYLLGLAFTINTFTRDTRTSILLPASILQFSILASFTLLIRQHGSNSLSPAEALLMLNLLIFPTYPMMCAVAGVRVGEFVGGQGLGIAIFILDSLWLAILQTWFWATGYKTLPRLGTLGFGFFYTRVHINGWFRYLGIVLVAFNWITILFLVGYAIYIWLKSLNWWWTKEDPEVRDWEETIGYVMIGVCAFIFLWSLAPEVAAAEMIIRYNHLEPTNSLSSPGQLIPFVTGLITLLDSILGLWRHIMHQDFDWSSN